MSESSDPGDSLRQQVETKSDTRTEDQRFERALGRFIIAFADTEAELYKVLINYSAISNPVARAIFSGNRAKGMMDLIRSIAHNTAMPTERIEDLEYVFSQLSAINTMRDHIVHHVSDSYSFLEPSKRIVANTRASRYGNAKGYEVGSDTIDAMTWDLYGIANHLNMHWGPRDGSFVAWHENPEDQSPTKWAYKPLQPIPSWERAPSNSSPNKL